jgi:hypothetical protein
VSGVRRVTEQRDVAAMPRFVLQREEADPVRPVRQKGMSAEVVGEELLAVRDAFLFGCLVEARLAPGRRGTFDDKRAGCRVEWIRVNLEQAVFVLTEEEGERLEGDVRSEPDELRAVLANRWNEVGFEAFAHPAVDAIGADDEINPIKILLA